MVQYKGCHLNVYFASALPQGGAVGSLVTRQKTGKFISEHTLSKHLVQTWPLLLQVFQTTAYNNSYDQDKGCTRLLSSEIIHCDFYFKKFQLFKVTNKYIWLFSLAFTLSPKCRMNETNCYCWDSCIVTCVCMQRSLLCGRWDFFQVGKSTRSWNLYLNWLSSLQRRGKKMN